jgi:catechol 2,3-dioxygenase-like lactoylglutathione lyase family enzyme
MPVNKLDHYSIRTTDLDATREFYTAVLGFEVGPRPNFPFPGVWLYQGGIAVVHVIGIDPNDSSGLMDYLGDRDQGDKTGTGMIDHVAFLCSDIDGVRTKIQAASLEFKERQVPALDLRQIFVNDPSGVVVELNFPGVAAAA